MTRAAKIELGLRVVQINPNHCEAATEDLMLFTTEEKIDVALVQEPWIAGDKIPGLGSKEYMLIHSQSVGKKRACIVARRSLKLTLLSQYSINDLSVAICEDSRLQTINGLSIYALRGGGTTTRSCLQTHVGEAKRRGRHLVLGCDANDHHVHQGSKDINVRGESIMDIILTNNLTICNRGDVPRYINRIREGVINLTLTTEMRGL